MNKSQSVFTIAEVAQAHDGSLGMAHAYIDALAKRNVDAVKFQIHLAYAESSIHEPFRKKFSYQDKTRYDYWERMSFSLDQWMGLKQHCDESGIEFMVSVFSNTAVDWAEKIGVKRYKIGSGEVNNMLLLEKISQTKKPVILSSGMSSIEELDRSIHFFKSKKTDVSLLQCTTSYPTRPEQYGFNLMSQFKERYGIKVGFSDHSAKVSTGIAAVALGADILEFHVAFSEEQFGPDTSSSLNLNQVEELINGIKNIKSAIEHPVNKNDIDEFKGLKSIFEKSLAVNKDLSRGHILGFEDLEAKKPKNKGIDPAKFKELIGKTLKTEKSAWSFLTENDLE
jgi:N-acetylneuraminate synthase